MRAIRNGLNGAGIPIENSKGEWGPGQEEINVRYAEALDMADNHVIMKNGCKEIADLMGKSITSIVACITAITITSRTGSTKNNLYRN